MAQFAHIVAKWRTLDLWPGGSKLKAIKEEPAGLRKRPGCAFACACIVVLNREG